MSSEELLRNYFKVEMTRDIDAVLDLYAPDATFQTPERIRRGRAEIRSFYEDAAHRFPHLDVTIVNAFDRGDWADGEWDATMSGPDTGELRLQGVNVTRFEGGRIAEVRSYYDSSAYLPS
ncbi:nuclear transport factor 2 family protein [Kribbella sp. NPDC050820]|uniref:nuclear transport factor 2 family protein n=1 Tax=Kribbella sp. NPDC050820 TaxID=3155408 RepID=UPI0033DA8AEF